MRVLLHLVALLLMALPILAGAGVTRVDRVAATVLIGGRVVDTTASLPLPHHWDKKYPGQSGQVTYAFDLPEVNPDAANALLIQRIGNRFEVRIDGRRVLQNGEPDAWENHGKQPFLMTLPPSAQKRGTRIELVVWADALSRAGLTPVLVGPEQELRPLYEDGLWSRTTLSYITITALGIMGVMSAVLWWRERDSLYAFFALATLQRALRVADTLMTALPMPPLMWSGLLALAYIGTLLCLCLFCLRMFDELTQGRRRAFAAGYAVLATATVLSFIAGLPGVYTVALFLTIPVGLYSLYLSVRGFARNRSLVGAVLLLAAGIVIAVGVRDWWVIRLDEAGIGINSWSRQALLLFDLSMAWVVVDRFIKSHQQFRALNASLAARIHDREQELGAAFQRERVQLQEATLQTERHRIMRDVHDGVGARLAGLLNTLRGGQAQAGDLEEQVQQSIDELRLTVDSMETMEGDLTTLLGNLRYRLTRRFEAAGITLNWQVTPLPALPHLTPADISHIQKLLLEVFTNIIRHARASVIEVRTAHQDERVQVRISDNGRGFDTGSVAGGRGLQNMRFRATALKADLVVASSPRGTTVTISLEVAPPPASGK
ncbi:7TM diverse intracellular signaling domain-containing protein [soil metagenome]